MGIGGRGATGGSGTGLTNTQVNQLAQAFVGAAVSGTGASRILTLTRNSAAQPVELSIPAAAGGATDGVVASGAFDASTQDLVLTLSTGSTVTIALDALVTSAELTAAIAAANPNAIGVAALLNGAGLLDESAFDSGVRAALLDARRHAHLEATDISGLPQFGLIVEQGETEFFALGSTDWERLVVFVNLTSVTGIGQGAQTTFESELPLDIEDDRLHTFQALWVRDSDGSAHTAQVGIQWDRPNDRLRFTVAGVTGFRSGSGPRLRVDQVQGLAEVAGAAAPAPWAAQGAAADQLVPVARLPAAVMLDSEFTAGAVRTLLSIPAGLDFDDVITGGSVAGTGAARTLTLTQADGGTIDLVVGDALPDITGLVSNIRLSGTDLLFEIEGTAGDQTLSLASLAGGSGGGDDHGAQFVPPANLLNPDTNHIAIAPPGFAQADLSDGDTFRFFIEVANTGATTLQLGSLPDRPLVRVNGTALTAGELSVGRLIEATWDATNTRWVSNVMPGGGTSTIGAATDSASGTVELATGGEARAGTDTARAVTPAGLSTTIGAINPNIAPYFTRSATTPTRPGGGQVTNSNFPDTYEVGGITWTLNPLGPTGDEFLWCSLVSRNQIRTGQFAFDAGPVFRYSDPELKVEVRSPRGLPTAVDDGRVIIDGGHAYIVALIVTRAVAATATWAEVALGYSIETGSEFRGVYYDAATAPTTGNSIGVGDFIWVSSSHSWHQLSQTTIGGQTIRHWRPVGNPVTTIGAVANEEEATRRAVGTDNFAEWGGRLYRSTAYTAGTGASAHREWRALTNPAPAGLVSSVERLAYRRSASAPTAGLPAQLHTGEGGGVNASDITGTPPIFSASTITIGGETWYLDLTSVPSGDDPLWSIHVTTLVFEGDTPTRVEFGLPAPYAVQRSGAQIVAAIDDALGDSTWQEGGGSGDSGPATAPYIDVSIGPLLALGNPGDTADDDHALAYTLTENPNDYDKIYFVLDSSQGSTGAHDAESVTVPVPSAILAALMVNTGLAAGSEMRGQDGVISLAYGRGEATGALNFLLARRSATNPRELWVSTPGITRGGYDIKEARGEKFGGGQAPLDGVLISEADYTQSLTFVAADAGETDIDISGETGWLGFQKERGEVVAIPAAEILGLAPASVGDNAVSGTNPNFVAARFVGDIGGTLILFIGWDATNNRLLIASPSSQTDASKPEPLRVYRLLGGVGRTGPAGPPGVAGATGPAAAYRPVAIGESNYEFSAVRNWAAPATNIDISGERHIGLQRENGVIAEFRVSDITANSGSGIVAGTAFGLAQSNAWPKWVTEDDQGNRIVYVLGWDAANSRVLVAVLQGSVTDASQPTPLRFWRITPLVELPAGAVTAVTINLDGDLEVTNSDGTTQTSTIPGGAATGAVRYDIDQTTGDDALTPAQQERARDNIEAARNISGAALAGPTPIGSQFSYSHSSTLHHTDSTPFFTMPVNVGEAGRQANYVEVRLPSITPEIVPPTQLSVQYRIGSNIFTHGLFDANGLATLNHPSFDGDNFVFRIFTSSPTNITALSGTAQAYRSDAVGAAAFALGPGSYRLGRGTYLEFAGGRDYFLEDLDRIEVTWLGGQRPSPFVINDPENLAVWLDTQAVNGSPGLDDERTGDIIVHGWSGENPIARMFAGGGDYHLSARSTAWAAFRWYRRTGAPAGTVSGVYTADHAGGDGRRLLNVKVYPKAGVVL